MRLVYLIALILSALLPAAIAFAAEEGPVTLQLEANPTGVQVHVPIHLHTIMKNSGHEPLVGGFSWNGIRRKPDWGFTFLASRNGGRYYDPITISESVPFETARPALEVPHYRDEQYLPGQNFTPGDVVQRHDMFVLHAPGEYKIKAALKWPDEEPFYSEPVEITVREPDPDSCISDVLTPEERKNLGRCLYNTFYGDLLPTRKWWERKDILGIVDRIQANCPDNPYGEYLDYLKVMYILMHDRPPFATPRGARDENEDYAQDIVDFMNAYPDSWLIPDLARAGFELEYELYPEEFDWSINLVQPYLPQPGEPLNPKFIKVRKLLEKERPSALP